MAPREIEKRLTMIHEEVIYLRTQVDNLREQLTKVVWKVGGIGAGSGALGFVVALLLDKVLS